MLPRALHIDPNLRKSCFLFGPRGTGKTHWVTQHFADALYIDLLKYHDFARLQAEPSRLENLVLAHDTPWTIIDEVQRVPALLNEVHRLIEHQQQYFILTGSSSRKLRRGSANLLAGRALTYHMHPLIAEEIGETFDLNHALRYGLLPACYLGEQADAVLASYVATYLREEVMQEGLVRNLASFNRFMEVASFSQGSQLNLVAIAREVGISRKVIASYFEILEDLLIAIRLPSFTKRAQRKVVAHPKFYYFDAGIFQQIRPRGPLDSPEEINGPACETLFLQHCRAIIDYYTLDLSLFFWRTKSGLEVDFIAYGGSGLYAFEIKSKQHINISDLKGLKEFKKDYPMAQCYLLYLGEQREKHGDILVLPMREALVSLTTIFKPTDTPS